MSSDTSTTKAYARVVVGTLACDHCDEMVEGRCAQLHIIDHEGHEEYLCKQHAAERSLTIPLRNDPAVSLEWERLADAQAILREKKRARANATTHKVKLAANRAIERAEKEVWRAQDGLERAGEPGPYI